MTQTEDETPNHETARLTAIELDDSLATVPSADVEHERQIAIYDLLQDNYFHVVGRDQGPYKLHLSILEGRLMFGISDQENNSCAIIGLALSPFRRIVKDYFMICENYFQAIRTSTPSQIETIDMARRGLHNEGSEILKERLKGKIDIDFDTARRLFTLVCVLHWRG
jgi:uncharacterized protein (UPF0262 family)